MGTTFGKFKVPTVYMPLSTYQDLEASSDVVTGMSQIFSYDVYELLDPGSTLSYVIPNVAMNFGFGSKNIPKYSLVSTPVGESTC